MQKIYVTEDINVHINQQAEELLKKNNDLGFYNNDEKGIHKVSKNRWETAQKYERKTWMENNLYVSDDRNYEHLSRFGDLNDIFNSETNNIIELGCGPFTNLRLITQVINPKKITLLDPLIESYLSHPNCSYKNMNLNDIPVEVVGSPIENFETDEKFDVVVMINVIEHCYDVDLIFDKIINILNDDGIFIFSDVYFNDVYDIVSNTYDAGHPLRLSESKLLTFLLNFNEIRNNKFQKLYSQDWRNDIYFIGKKIKK